MWLKFESFKFCRVLGLADSADDTERQPRSNNVITRIRSSSSEVTLYSLKFPFLSVGDESSRTMLFELKCELKWCPMFNVEC